MNAIAHSRQIRSALAVVLTALLVLTSTAGAAIELRYTQVIKVVPGNTLSGLAVRWCGSAAAWPILYQQNRTVVRNPDLIYPGQRLNVTCQTLVSTSRSSAAVAGPVAGWVHPIRAGLRGISCWGAPRVGHIHHGVDLDVAYGTPIRAASAGTVEVVKYQGGGAGWYVMLGHAGGIKTVYMHMRSRSPLRVGARVSAGAVVGYVGATGNAKGPHLHFEVHRGAWNYINPAPFMRAHGAPVGC